MISAIASASPVDPPISAAQIPPATTTAAADPKLRTRAWGATSSTYREAALPNGGPVGSPLTPERSLEREGVLSHVAE